MPFFFCKCDQRCDGATGAAAAVANVARGGKMKRQKNP